MSLDQHQIENDFRAAAWVGRVQEMARLREKYEFDISVAERFAGATALHMAVEGGQVAATHFLVEHGAEVNKANLVGETPLITVLKENHKLDKTRPALLNILLKNGASIECKEEGEKAARPLHMAASLGCRESVHMLLEHGASPNVEDDRGRTPMHYAASTGFVLVMQMLLTQRAELEPVDKDGWTPFHCACESGQLDVVQFMLDCGGRMTLRTNSGDSGLHLAARQKRQEIKKVVVYLISQGADLDKKDSRGNNLKQYVKQNYFIKDAISEGKALAKKHGKQLKPRSSANFSAGSSPDIAGSGSSSGLWADGNTDGFAVLDLRGEELYSATGFKMAPKTRKKGKPTHGNVVLCKHGLVFKFRAGRLMKSDIEEFHPWKPNVGLDPDPSTNTLAVEFQETEEGKDEKSEACVFGIKPCRAQETMETIQNAINHMFPTYAHNQTFKNFIAEHGEEKAVLESVSAYQLLDANVRGIEARMQTKELEIKKHSGVGGDALVAELQGKLDALTMQMNSAKQELTSSARGLVTKWEESKRLIFSFDGALARLKEEVENMIIQNQHWKIIGLSRQAIAQLNNFRTILVRWRAGLIPVMPQLLGLEVRDSKVTAAEPCCVCKERPANVRFRPCDQVVVCSVCVAVNPDPVGFKLCPVCQRLVENTQVLGS